MAQIWDYDPKILKKTKSGRKLLLERQINFGPGKGEKIKLGEVKKYWNKLNIDPGRRLLLKMLIWGKKRS